MINSASHRPRRVALAFAETRVMQGLREGSNRSDGGVQFTYAGIPTSIEFPMN